MLASCRAVTSRSPEMRERLDRLSQGLEELNDSKAYLAEWDVDKLKSMRDDYVLALLEEGERCKGQCAENKNRASHRGFNRSFHKGVNLGFRCVKNLK